MRTRQGLSTHAVLRRPVPRLLALLSVAIACAHRPAGAQTLQEQVLEQKGLAPQPAPGQWSVTLGGGVAVGPDFLGSSNDRAHFAPLIDILYGKTLFLGTNGLGVNLINRGGFRIGPVLGYQGGRNDNRDPNLNGIGDIHSSLTAGVFADYRFQHFDIGATVRQSITHTENGLTGLAHVDYLIGLPRARAFFSFGPDLEFANARYNQTWYGITPTQSLDSGLPVFTPSGGVNDVGLHGSMTYFYSKHLLLRAFVNFKEITGDAANSPIVEDGRRNFVILGVGLAYHF